MFHRLLPQYYILMNPSILIKLLPLFILISSTTGQEFSIEDEQSTAVPETDLSSSGDPGDVILDPVVDHSVPEIWNIEISISLCHIFIILSTV